MVIVADLLTHLLDLVSTYSVCRFKLLFRSFINQSISLLVSMPPLQVMVKEMVWWLRAGKKLDGLSQFAVFRRAY